MGAIQIGPDGHALLAERLMRRLLRDGLIPQPRTPAEHTQINEMVEVLADEIHQDVLDATLRRDG